MIEPKILRNVEDGSWAFWCPGCKCGHVFYVDKPSPIWCADCGGHWRVGQPENHLPFCKNPATKMGPYHWTFNGDMERPTFAPSLLCGLKSPPRCHLFVRDGMIQFLGDCAHEFANRTVPLEPF